MHDQLIMPHFNIHFIFVKYTEVALYNPCQLLKLFNIKLKYFIVVKYNKNYISTYMLDPFHFLSQLKDSICVHRRYDDL